jgi:V-type H+-transporting ATPase subunit A
LALSRDATWEFEPNRDIRVGSHVAGGDIIGCVQETVLVRHRILVPPNSCGTVTYIAPAGQYKVQVGFWKKSY